jgi:hypothetical protein
MKPANDIHAQSLLPLQTGSTLGPTPLSPGQFLANKDRLFRWTLAALFVSGTASVLALLLLWQTVGQPPWFVGFDPAGNPYSGRGTSFQKARKLHVQQAIDATTTLLYRNQNDFDFPERLPDLFSPPALEDAMRLKNNEAQEFQDKAISQKAHVARVEALDTRPDLVRVAVSGKLERNGVFHQQPFIELISFTLTLTFRFNPDLTLSGRWPTVVVGWNLQYDK